MNILNKLSTERGATMAFIGRKTGIHPVSVRNHMSGKTVPSAESILKYADFFGVPVREIIEGIKSGGVAGE